MTDSSELPEERPAQVVDSVAPAAQPIGPLDVGEVVQEMARFMREHGLFAVGASALFAAPETAYLLFKAFTVRPDWAHITDWLEGTHSLPVFVGTVLSMLATLTLAFAVHAFQQKQTWSPASYVLEGVSAIGRGLVVQVGVGFAVVLGLLALVVPGLIVGAATFIALPLIAIEKCSVPNAMNRCFSLTRGHRWRIGVLVLVVVLLPLGLYLLAYMSIFPTDDLSATEGDWLFRIQFAAVFEAVVNPLITTATGVLSATIYTMLVRSTDVVDTKALQEVFE